MISQVSESVGVSISIAVKQEENLGFSSCSGVLQVKEMIG